MTDKRKQRVKQTRTGKGVHPQKAPKNNYFAMLAQTEEGRQHLVWQILSPIQQ